MRFHGMRVSPTPSIRPLRRYVAIYILCLTLLNASTHPPLDINRWISYQREKLRGESVSILWRSVSVGPSNSGATNNPRCTNTRMRMRMCKRKRKRKHNSRYRGLLDAWFPSFPLGRVSRRLYGLETHSPLRSEPTAGKITLQVAVAVAAEAQTPAARSRVASVLVACPSIDRTVIDRVAAAGHSETLADAHGLLTRLSSNASVARAVRGMREDGRDGGETDARL